ncbi:uncharacterized protein EHS24_003284 [Apiotrichum porosum]|uniref:Glutamyl-tRNA(Gln) amidotransferase subunit F, mitochondrial n=1 Tax=Apiotrichum porosum TaxID=105984 RepID=A0A427XG24_9TREE|nr:uncharacterized protein EHS24_003284 [Apiotrichum porosum]RSH77717.1 hypothetical protein EHS24_003284 [Apiotrichum porosum]
MLARYRLVARLTRCLSTSSRSSTAASSPLRPSVKTTDLGLPVTPLPDPIPSVPRTPLDRAALHRLCKLAALNPPAKGSEAETQLLADLGELVGLMDLVGEAVTLDADVGELLTAGVGEIVIDAGKQRGNEDKDGEERGRELLQYATRRVGDYYGFKSERA